MTNAVADKPAFETHPDGKEPGVELRLSGIAHIGAPVTLRQLMVCCKNDAENGRDPFAMGTVEVGLLLEQDKYERLVSYAKSLKITHSKRRRHS